jgi:hypothetical protein
MNAEERDVTHEWSHPAGRKESRCKNCGTGVDSESFCFSMGLRSPIVVSPRLVSERGLQCQPIGGGQVSDRRFHLVLASRCIGSARRELLAADYAKRTSGERGRRRFAECLESATDWLVMADVYRQRARGVSVLKVGE